MSKENDFVSAKLAVKAGYHKVTDKGTNHTIVAFAGFKNNFDLVKLLVDCGVDPSENGEGCYNALHWFCYNNNFTAVKYFCELPWVNRIAPSKYKWSLLHVASYLDNYDICEYLLTKSDVDVNMRNKDDGKTPLSVAKSDKVRNLLKSHGAVL